jgi:thiol-disulfide isomerase/thioredoxin
MDLAAISLSIAILFGENHQGTELLIGSPSGPSMGMANLRSEPFEPSYGSLDAICGIFPIPPVSFDESSESNEVNAELVSLHGERLDLKSFRGNVVLLHFWWSRCVACRAGMGRLKRLEKEYSSAGLKVIGVSIETSTLVVSNAVGSLGLTWPQFVEKDRWVARLREQHGEFRLPSWWLIDRKGFLRHRDGTSNTDRRIIQLLKE